MPSLNQSGFIERSIRSVLSQAGVDLELIVVDGGSTDGTQRLLTRLAREAQGRLRWVSEADGGPAQAVNKAIGLSSHDMIGWLNADDVYTPGALERAARALQTNPRWLMVYGHANHIDECDQVIGAYPTLMPSAGMEKFADGCFICQPTVLFRKAMVHVLGLLDEGLRAAFDFEWWLRLFKAHPQRVGFVDAAQAASRLHGGCITRGQRETVIREGMRVLARHLGTSPLHWFKTYVDELLGDYPHGRQIANVRSHLRRFSNDISGHLAPGEQRELKKFMGEDRRLQLAVPDAYLEVYPDGWLPVRATLRVRCHRRLWRRVELRGRHVSKGAGPLQLEIRSPDGKVEIRQVERPGPFRLEFHLPKPAARPAYWVFTIDASGGFIPSAQDTTSNDSRELACRIERLRLRAS